MRIFAYNSLLCILAVFFFLGLSFPGYSQNDNRITLSLENASLQKVFSSIEAQTSYRFIYTSEQIKDCRPVSLSVTKGEIQEVLKKLFKGQALDFSLEDKYIIIRHSDRKPVEEQFVLRGLVTNEKGNPVSGCTVTVMGTDVATATTSDGSFILQAVKPGSVIVFTATDVEKLEVNIRNQKYLSVTMKTRISRMDEVQIIAYGMTTRRFNTGDVTMVKGETIAEQPVSNPLAALEGRVAGLVVTQNSGVPGGSYTVQIQGRNSLRTTGNDPLFIVDGVPFPSAPISSVYLSDNIIQQGSPLNNINPSDIESISILKDADATAIYGARGANGVILITTKKGKQGPTRFEINAYSGTGHVTRELRMLNTSQYLAMRHEALKNDQQTPNPNYDYDLLQWDTTKYTDWQRQLTGGTARLNNLQMNLSGGNANTSFLLGGGLIHETTVFPGDFNDTKISGHLNLNHHSDNQKLNMGLSVIYNLDNSHLFNTDLTSLALYLPPNTPDLHGSGNQILWPSGIYDNPYADLLQKYKGNTHNFISNLLLSYQLTGGIQLKLNAGYNDLNINESQMNPLNSYSPVYGYTLQNVSTNFGSRGLRSWILEPQVNWEHQIARGKLSILVGTTFQENNSDGQTIIGTGFSNESLMGNMAAASSLSVQENNDALYRYEAVFARINYNWQDKYLVNATGRRDGSSRFGPGNQFANFGALGLAWIFSKENVIQKNLSFLSFGKIRASYGTTGSDQIGDYGYLDSWTTTIYPYQSVSGLQPVQLYNPDFAWETNRKAEMGMELGFMKDRIVVSGTFYHNRSSNQLVGISLPAITGFASVQSNLPATVQNSGWEIEWSSTNIRSKNFSWTTSANVTIPRNKLISFPGLAGSPYNYVYTIGQPLNVFRGYHYLGVDPKTGIYQFQDYDQDGQISFPNDYQYTQKAGIDFYGGLSNSFQYKGFKLDIFFQFVKQMGTIYPGSIGGLPSNQPENILHRWQHPGDITSIEKFTQDYGSEAATAGFNTAQSNFKIGDASFIRLKNISLSYRLPSSITGKLNVQDIRVYLQAQNVLTFTSYLGLDPENQSYSRLPPLRMLTMGIQINL